ncbi:O-antigen polymerase [Sphingomonas sp. PB2P19]|uniref:O-antigen polymerase n=1 Tax=Sphingomonas rhamnosi TaxID=3096156 RepID=UPI002FCAF4F0
MRVDWLSPVPIFLFIVIMGVILPVFSFLNYTDSFSITWPFLFVDKVHTAEQALAIYVAITILFVFSCQRGIASVGKASGSRQEGRGSIALPPGRFHVIAAILGGFTILVFGALVIAFGGIGEILAGASDRTRAFAGFQGLFLALNVGVSVVLVWFVQALRYRSGVADWTAFIGFALIALLIVALQGQKSTIFIVIAALAVVYNRRVRRIGLAPLLVGIIVTFVGLMAYHVYKQEYLVLGRVVSFSGGKQFWSSASEFLDTQLFGNFMQVQTMSVLIEGMPEPLPFQWGYTYIAGVLTLIPRVIFPDKPLPSTGTFTQAFWPDQWNNFGTTLPAGVFGEAYMNFGVSGALLGALLLGWFTGRIYGRHLRNPEDDAYLLDYAIALAALLHFFRGEFTSVMILLLSIALPMRLMIEHRKKAVDTATAQITR